MAFGVLPLRFAEGVSAGEVVEPGDVLTLDWGDPAPKAGEPVALRNATRDAAIPAVHDLSERQLRTIAGGGLLELLRKEGA